MLYLGQVATVMDAEMLGVAVGWEQTKKVATDSQATIGRILDLRFDRPRSWIEAIVVAAQKGKAKEIAWVKAHDGIPWDGFKAKETGGIGHLFKQSQTATPAGIKAIFRCNRISEQVRIWDRNAIRGLTYITTDSGPQKNWRCKIGRAEEDVCRCGERGQNEAHIMKFRMVGSGKGRTLEAAEKDPEWCALCISVGIFARGIGATCYISIMNYRKRGVPGLTHGYGAETAHRLDHPAQLPLGCASPRHMP